jgi:outer membrane protein assembly factor BamB
VTVAGNGLLFYATSERADPYGARNVTHPVVWCVDLKTGELKYRRDLPGTSVGSLRIALEILPRLKIDPKLGYAPSAYSLWVMDMTRGIWEVDPWTGNTIYYNSTLPGGAYWKNAIYIGGYPSSGYLTKWSTRLKAVEWTKPMTWNDRTFETQWISQEGLLVVRESRQNGYPPYNIIRVWNATTGEPVAVGSGTTDPGTYVTQGGWGDVLYDGKIFVGPAIDGKFRAFDLKTGNLVLTSDFATEMPWGAFGLYTASAAYGNVYMGAWDGYLYCMDAKTLGLKWKFYMGDNPDTAMGHNVPWGVSIIGDGKVYVVTGEHTPPNPVPRGNKLYCIDAFTGEQIWNITFMYQSRSTVGIHAGILWYQNRYDGRIYFFGKGPTAVTVSASPKVVSNGQKVLIEGTVTDQSPGAKDTPAIADEYMTPWMEYLYMQKPMPTDAKGVPVLVQACLSNGTLIDIGWTTSDIMGHFEITWTPPAPDTYKIIATFLGSKSYYLSAAETALTVTEAPVAAEEEAPTGLTTTDLGVIVAIIVAVITLALVTYDISKVRKLLKK